MGRHAGWIAAAGGLVAGSGHPGVILFPEIEFDQDKFLAKVKAKVENTATAPSWSPRAATTGRQVPGRAGHP
jgi:6-phosphofructokinase